MLGGELQKSLIKSIQTRQQNELLQANDPPSRQAAGLTGQQISVFGATLVMLERRVEIVDDLLIIWRHSTIPCVVHWFEAIPRTRVCRFKRAQIQGCLRVLGMWK